MPLRSDKALSQVRLLKTYVDEAERFRKLVSNVTTTALRPRLLEEAANQEWLARQAQGDASPARAGRTRGQNRSPSRSHAPSIAVI
jgi:hypothetical protein